ncbi:MAG: hypothetical protein HC844_16675 [Tabrizicola sp.]|nr:hypothetical protein [Tabrizicola sp.]
MDLFDALFAPLARLLVARGVLFPALVERMKAHYVQAALHLSGGSGTDSRITVMTGLQRRDVARLRGAEIRDQRPNHLARLVALWLTEPEYQANGRPRDLPRNGPAPSFEALATALRRDVHPRTMLDALLATGTVGPGADGQTVRLLQSSYQPLAGSEDQITYLARNLGDHMSAASENVQGHQPPHFERAVHYSGLTENQVTALDARFREGQMALLRQIGQEAATMKRENSAPGAMRLRAGGYFYQTRDET